MDRDNQQNLIEAFARIDRELVRLLGDRCKDFDITCSTCRAWRTRDDLDAVINRCTE